MKKAKPSEAAPQPSRTKPAAAVTVTLPTALLIAAITGAAGFAIGTATSSTSTQAPPPQARPTPDPTAEATMGEALPVGHPAVSGAATSDTPTEGALVWTPPPRWQAVPSTSSMRLATYKIPRAPGDTDDAELSVTHVGGSIDANIDRWVGQFDAVGQKTAKRTRRTVAGLSVTIVEIQGTYSGGMDPSGPKAGWALLGAIVETPGMPYFFKMTGPAKTVAAARAELDTMLGTLK